jgi:Sulfotransferase family
MTGPTDQGIRTPPPAPLCPEGWRTGPPDFVGVGAQRSGTTRWFDLIVAHPDVASPLATRKELHFFGGFHAGGFTAADAAAYHDYFPRPEGQITGEWTPVYLAAPWTPSMLAAAAPDAKLLVLLRDPVERYLSGMEHHHRRARAAAQPLKALAPLDAFMRGLYHSQLTNLLAHFARSQVLVLQYERCVREPLSELRRTYEFLGLREAEAVPDLDARPNLQPDKPPLHPDARRALVEAYTDDVVSLVDGFPEIDLGLWPNFAQLVVTGPERYSRASAASGA